MRMRERSPSSSASPRPRPGIGLHALRVAAAAALAMGCDGGPPAPHAVVLAQPEDQAVFEGQTGFFQVRASGTDGLTYQWRLNGAPIPGATDSHVTTQRTVLGDDGSTYSVDVTNAGADPVESRAARLTVYPPLDLRFQWVGAPYRPTYATGTNLLPGFATTWEGTGSPLLVGPICGGMWNCSWYYGVDPTVPGMTIAYQSGAIGDLGVDWASALPTDTVVSSLDLEEPSGLYAVSLSRTTQAGEFTPVVQGSVAPDQLQATATSEGGNGRVLTAVSFQGGLVSYVSYGWSLAPSALYEARVVLSTFDTVASDASSLAAEGYALTAFGAGNQAANGLVLVGTRVQGSTAPRLLEVVQPSGNVPLPQGYAIVAYFYDVGTGYWVIVEQ